MSLLASNPAYRFVRPLVTRIGPAYAGMGRLGSGGVRAAARSVEGLRSSGDKSGCRGLFARGRATAGETRVEVSDAAEDSASQE